MDEGYAKLVEVFAADTAENLTRMEDALIALEEHPDDAELVDVLFRAAHSVKGDASIVGFDRLGDAAHAVENVLDRLRARTTPVTRALVTRLLSAVDALRALVSSALAGDDRVTPAQAELFARLDERESGPAAREHDQTA